MPMKSMVQYIKSTFLRTEKSKLICILSFYAFISYLLVRFTFLDHGAIPIGYDGNFHKIRIEGLAEGLKNWDLIPRVNYSYFEGLGYGVPMFYSDFFLYLPALLRVLGLSLSQSYIVLIYLIEVTTLIVSFFSRYAMDKSKRGAFLFSILYSFAPYHVYNVYKRIAIGELWALAFFPLAFYGIYQILYKDYTKWYWLTIGMTCILLSHVLSSLMFVFIIVLLLLFNASSLWKEKQRLLSLTKATLATIPLVSFYLVPMLEQMSFQDLKVKTTHVFNVNETVQTLSSFIVDNVLPILNKPTVGAYLFVLLIIYIVRWKDLNKETKHFLAISCISIALAIKTPLWDLLADTPMNVIQFPFRFLAIQALLIPLFLSFNHFKWFNKKWFLVIFTLVITYNILFFPIVSKTSLKWYVPQPVFNQTEDYYIGAGEEYLPTVSSSDELKSYIKDAVFPIYNNKNNKGEIINYSKKYNTINFYYSFDSPPK